MGSLLNVYGGYAAGQVFKDCYQFDTESSVWSLTTPHEALKKPRYGYALCEVEEKYPWYSKTVHIFGGRDSNHYLLTDSFSFQIPNEESMFLTLHLLVSTGINRILSRNLIREMI